MRYGVLLLTVIVLLGTPLVLGEEAKETGILMDRACGQGMAANAEKVKKHGPICALMESCKQSGFGLILDGRFLSFDETGNKMALVIFQNTESQNNIQVEVTGDFSGDQVKVKRIIESTQ